MAISRTAATRFVPAVALLAIVGALGGLGFAQARSLGTLTANQLGTTSSVVAPCQTSGSIALTWANFTFNAGASPYYSANQLSVSGFNAACQNKLYKVTVANSAGTALATASGTMPGAGSTTTFTLSAQVNLTLANQITLVIYG